MRREKGEGEEGGTLVERRRQTTGRENEKVCFLHYTEDAKSRQKKRSK